MQEETGSTGMLVNLQETTIIPASPSSINPNIRIIQDQTMTKRPRHRATSETSEPETHSTRKGFRVFCRQKSNRKHGQALRAISKLHRAQEDTIEIFNLILLKKVHIRILVRRNILSMVSLAVTRFLNGIRKDR